jgi:hypothetical protein
MRPVKQLLRPDNLTSTDTTERDAGMLLPHPRPRTVAWLVMRSTVDSHPHDDTV